MIIEKIESDTQVKQHDFKAAIENFCNHLEIMKNKLSLAVKDKQAQATELFKAV